MPEIKNYPKLTITDAHIKYVGGGAAEGFTNFSKKLRSPGDHRAKYFMAQ